MFRGDVSTKALFMSALAPPNVPASVPVYEPLFYEKPHNIRRQLFWMDHSGRMFPRYPAVPGIQKDVIKHYVASHSIPKESIVDFWMEYVDCLLTCPNFEEEAPPDFRAWAYGRLCRYDLLQKKTRTMTTAYDPATNYSL